jgi:hypothetical protein
MTNCTLPAVAAISRTPGRFARRLSSRGGSRPRVEYGLCPVSRFPSPSRLLLAPCVGRSALILRGSVRGATDRCTALGCRPILSLLLRSDLPRPADSWSSEGQRIPVSDAGGRFVAKPMWAWLGFGAAVIAPPAGQPMPGEWQLTSCMRSDLIDVCSVF